jgi:hypothetical protein
MAYKEYSLGPVERGATHEEHGFSHGSGRKLSAHFNCASPSAQFARNSHDFRGLNGSYQRAGDDAGWGLLDIQEPLRNGVDPVSSDQRERAIAIQAAVGSVFRRTVAH